MPARVPGHAHADIDSWICQLDRERIARWRVRSGYPTICRANATDLAACEADPFAFEVHVIHMPVRRAPRGRLGQAPVRPPLAVAIRRRRQTSDERGDVREIQVDALVVKLGQS